MSEDPNWYADKITEEGDYHFHAQSAGWKIRAKWDGCVEFTRMGGDEDFIHICNLRDFKRCVDYALAPRLKRTQSV